jgi:hypothetical protein
MDMIAERMAKEHAQLWIDRDQPQSGAKGWNWDDT